MDVAPGLETAAYQELQQPFDKRLQWVRPLDACAEAGTTSFHLPTARFRDVERILIHTIFNAYHLLQFPVARPKALLAHEHFQRLVQTIQQLRLGLPANEFGNQGISVANADFPGICQLATQVEAVM